jgi:uncharacterized membrane protein
MSTPTGLPPRPRIQGLSDLIFGLALSISALTLIGQQPNNPMQFSFSLGLYGFSFLILIGLWQQYSSVTSILPAETSVLVDLNVALLFLVSIEPYLFNELFSTKEGMLASVSAVYSIDLAAMFLILTFFFLSLTTEEKHLIPSALLGRYKLRRNFTFVTALIFIVSIIPYFGDTIVWSFISSNTPYFISLRSVLWIAALGMSLGRRSVESHLIRKEKNAKLTPTTAVGK